MKSDAELLRDYVENQSDLAFTELVQRHVGLVYSAALRQVGGDGHLAKDAAQSVFCDLARKAPALLDHRVLAGWLYKSAHFAAAKAVRAERRRREIEQESFAMQQVSSDGNEPDWNRLRELLDSAMLELGEVDRDAVLLRFFSGKSFLEIGTALAMSEDTARKRVERSLDKLHALLGRRGVSSSAAGLALALSQHAVGAAPPGLAASLAGKAVSAAALTGGASAFLTVINIMNISKLAIVAGTIAVLGLGSAAYYRSFSHPHAARVTQIASTDQAAADASAPDLRTLSAAALRKHLEGLAGSCRSRGARSRSDLRALRGSPSGIARSGPEDRSLVAGRQPSV